MKKILIISLLFLMFTGCEKIEKLTQFSLDYTTSFTVTADLDTQTPINLQDVVVNIDDKRFDDYDTSKELIEEATIKTIELKLDANQTTTFDFLTDIDLYIEADGLPKVRIAWQNNMTDTGAQTVVLKNLSDNLAEYFKKDSIKISAVILTDQVLTQDVTFDVKLSFYINAAKVGV